MSRQDRDPSASAPGNDPRPADSKLANARFPNTRWSVVLAIREHDDGAAAKALEALCAMYWFPLYAFVRRRGKPAHEAEDLTQEFFSRLLEKGSLADVRREKGKLRSFLLTLMKRFLANEWERANAQKRGGGQAQIPIDQDWAEDRYHHEPSIDTTPEDLYECQWARTLLDQVFDLLREDFAARGKLDHYEAFKDALAKNTSESSYAAIAEKLATSEGAVKTAIFRMRRRYRELLEQQIERTVESPAEIELEIQHLFRVFEQ